MILFLASLRACLEPKCGSRNLNDVYNSTIGKSVEIAIKAQDGRLMSGRKEGDRGIRVFSLQAFLAKAPCELVKGRQIPVGYPQAFQWSQYFLKSPKLSLRRGAREDLVADNVGDGGNAVPYSFHQVFKNNGRKPTQKKVDPDRGVDDKFTHGTFGGSFGSI